MSLIVRLIGPKCMPVVFPQVSSFISEALQYTDDCTLADAEHQLSVGNWALLNIVDEEGAVKGAYVIAFNESPTGKIAIIVSAAGKGAAGKEVFSQVEDLLKKFGATSVQAHTRESVARLYKRVGFTEKAILVEKKLWLE